MTNKQNDENINELFEDSGNASSNIAFDDECIRLQGERQPVKNDAKTIDDDINDYVFTKPHKSKKRKVKSHSNALEDNIVFEENIGRHRHSKSKPRKKKKRLNTKSSRNN